MQLVIGDDGFQPLETQGSQPKCYACINRLVGTEKTCYSCSHGLTGIEKGDGEWFDEWECRCETWECRCKDLKQSDWICYCPICNQWFRQSKYLRATFSDIRTRWLANMVTYYRHDHRSWDAQARHIGKIYDEKTYERQKSIVNEQAKRQFLRNALPYLLHHKLTPENFKALQGTDEKTMKLAIEKLKYDQDGQMA
ncbi:hypothetical protein L0152_20315 [bacterium]|nr:hypothetical protein [bacterium]